MYNETDPIMPTVSGSLFHFPSYVKLFKLPKTL